MATRLAFATIVGGLLLAASLAGTSPDSASAITNCTPPAGEAGLNSTEQQLLQAINNLRANPPAGFSPVPALLNSPTLSQAAAWKSFDSSASGSGFSHTDSLGRSPSQRAQDCGHPSGVGENIAYGYGSVQSVMTAWIDSSGHLQNMMSPYWKVVGIGFASGGRWTTDFSAYNDSGQAAPGAPSPTNTPVSPPTNTPPPPAPTQPPTQAPAPVYTKNLSAGMNAIVYGGPTIPVAQAFQGIQGSVEVVYHWNGWVGAWERYVPGGPTYTRSFQSMVPGELYIIVMKAPATWTV